MRHKASAVALAALLLTAAAPAPPIKRGNDARDQGKALAAACKGRDGWNDPAPPARVFGNVWYVGTCGISVLLVTGPEGHILIDGATAEAAPAILANIRTAGFEPRDVRVLVGSHEHADHMGGFAALKAATGARLLVRAPARPVVQSGRADPADPQAGLLPAMAPVAVDGVLADADMVRVGPVALTAVATPGHTDGGTSWIWRSCEGRNCATIAYVDSLTAVARDGYRFSDHPARVATLRATFARLRRLQCDILITPHPGASRLFARLSGAEGLVDRDACRRLIHGARRALDARLAQEAAR